MEIASEVSHHKGFGWPLAAIFIVGETAGSGLVAVPNAIINTGIAGGSLLLIALCLLLGYTACTLGSNWSLMIRRWPQYQTRCRDPYPEMARRALGEPARIFTQSLIYVTLFGVIAVFSLLGANNITQLMALFNVHISPCIMLIVVALIVWPVMMLRSPMSFWQVSIGAAVSTTLAVLLIIYGISADLNQCLSEAQYPAPFGSHFSLGFGTLVFAYGGHPCFPTIQHDMREPQAFKWAVVASYSMLFLLYTPVALFAFFVYGDSMTDSVIGSIQTPWARTIINVMITAHVLLSLVIIANPLHQGAEQFIKVPHKFSLRRFFVRSSLLWSAIFTAATFPNFGVFLDLVGSSSMTLLCLIFPVIFGLYLEAGERLEETEKPSPNRESRTASFLEVIAMTPKLRLLLETLVIGIALICGITATTNAVNEFMRSELATPCYIRVFNEQRAPDGNAAFQCCGSFKNISISAAYSCTGP